MVEHLLFDCNASFGPKVATYPEERWRRDELLEDLDLAGIAGALVLHAQTLHYDPMLANLELIEQIAASTNTKQTTVKPIIQQFIDNITTELAKDNRIEFRDFGVFETKTRQARKAQNPKTLQPVQIPAKRTVKFKTGRRMKQKLNGQL